MTQVHVAHKNFGFRKTKRLTASDFIIIKLCMTVQQVRLGKSPNSLQLCTADTTSLDIEAAAAVLLERERMYHYA